MKSRTKRQATGKIEKIAPKRMIKNQLQQVDHPCDLVLVDDPSWRPGLPLSRRRSVATRSLRGDVLADLHSRRRIGDLEYRAGRLWQGLHEAAQLSAVGALDPGRAFVDVSHRYQDGITDRQQAAHRHLDRCAMVLGRVGAQLVVWVLAEGVTLEAAAARLGPGWGKAVCPRLRECLRTLAEELHLA